MIDTTTRVHGYTICDISFYIDVHDEPHYIKDRGYTHSARLVGDYTRTDLKRLAGAEIAGQRIIGVESFAVENQSNKQIGLLTKEKLW